MILVTGATGLVGSHLLIKLLEENGVVKALYRNKEKIEAVKKVFLHKNKADLFDNILWIEGNINDIPSLNSAFENVTEVYHCAALISFDPKDEEELRKTNIEGTANIVNCCIDFKVSRLCHVSSVAALGDPKNNEKIITETTEWNPEEFHSDYAITKYGAEMEVWRGHNEGLQVVIVNPGVIFGYGFPEQRSSVIFKTVKKGIPFFTKGKTGIVAVEDVVNCMVLLMHKEESTGNRFTIVAANLHIEKTLTIITDAMGLKRPFIYANKALSNIAWRLDWFISKVTGRKRKYTKAMAIASQTTTEYANTKIKEELHYDFINMEKYLALLSKEYL